MGGVRLSSSMLNAVSVWAPINVASAPVSGVAFMEPNLSAGSVISLIIPAVVKASNYNARKDRFRIG